MYGVVAARPGSCEFSLQRKGVRLEHVRRAHLPPVCQYRPPAQKRWRLHPGGIILYTWKRGERMKIDIRIDESCPEPQIIVVTARVTDEISELVRMLAGEQAQVIAGFRDGQVVVLEPGHIVRSYAASGRVYAEAESGTYLLRLRLYEMEQRLASQSFVRISNGELINLKKVRGFDLGFTGTICVSLSNGTVTYVSRRYVARIKQLLGI